MLMHGRRSPPARPGIAAGHLDFDTPPDGEWDLLSAGVYEHDIAAVRRAKTLANPPRLLCSVAAGVASFAWDVGDPEGVFGIGQWTSGLSSAVDAGLAEPEFLAAWRRRFGAVPDYPGVQAYAAGVIALCAARSAGSVEAGALWREVAALDMRTAFGRFCLDPATGEQVGHESVLTRWSGGHPTASIP